MSDAARALRHPWHDLERQRQGTTFGLWVFLASEVLFFGGLFLAYAVNRSLHPQEFALGAREANVFFGTVNTVILMTSSLSMALAVKAAEARLRRFALWMVATTLLLGTSFLVVKGFEYLEDIEHHLIPGPDFALPSAPAQLFWTLYWLMTGVHGLHVTAGLVVIGRLFWLGWRRELPVTTSPDTEATALYWHLVDVIWVLLFPLLYLAGRS
jgi:cytochrome c oxidase subunit 3